MFLGEIRLSTALDGSTLYCCPECHMALPERDLLEQHLMGHNLERRFVCDICGAALKRKDHLTRHKQSHNPERPFVCSVCLKAFKRKEQLTLHFVIHSGEKRHVCTECGKGMYYIIMYHYRYLLGLNCVGSQKWSSASKDDNKMLILLLEPILRSSYLCF